MKVCYIEPFKNRKNRKKILLSFPFNKFEYLHGCVDLCVGDGLRVFNFVTKSYWRASNFVTPPKKLETEGKVNIFFLHMY